MSENIFETQAVCLFGEYLHVDTGNELCTMVGLRPGGVQVQIPVSTSNADVSKTDRLIPSMAFLCAIFGPLEKYPRKVGLSLVVDSRQSDGSYVVLHETEPTYLDAATLATGRVNKEYQNRDYFNFHIRGMFGPIPLTAMTRVTGYALIDERVIKCGETYFIHKGD